jgi:hypothetical protein
MVRNGNAMNNCYEIMVMWIQQSMNWCKLCSEIRDNRYARFSKLNQWRWGSFWKYSNPIDFELKILSHNKSPVSDTVDPSANFGKGSSFFEFFHLITLFTKVHENRSIDPVWIGRDRRSGPTNYNCDDLWRDSAWFTDCQGKATPPTR